MCIPLSLCEHILLYTNKKLLSNQVQCLTRQFHVKKKNVTDPYTNHK